VAGDHLLPSPVSLIVTAAVAFITINSSSDVSGIHFVGESLQCFGGPNISSVVYKLLGKVAPLNRGAS